MLVGALGKLLAIDALAESYYTGLVGYLLHEGFALLLFAAEHVVHDALLGGFLVNEFATDFEGGLVLGLCGETCYKVFDADALCGVALEYL